MAVAVKCVDADSGGSRLFSKNKDPEAMLGVLLVLFETERLLVRPG
jgi:hypothetical protein